VPRPFRVCQHPPSSIHRPPYKPSATATLPGCSSLIEETTGASVSRGLAERLWPFDLANGSPINCD